jgi:hypothetical protein
LLADVVQIGIAHGLSRAKLLAGKAASSRFELLLINDGRFGVELSRLSSMPSVGRSLILARRAVEERPERSGDDPPEVDDASARIF